jgi:Ubiquitin family
MGSFLVQTLDGKMHEVSLHGTVEELKWTMSKKLGVPVSRLDLIANGRKLNDGKQSKAKFWHDLADH